jgi:3-methyladenine DNA glycosylase/8-oxoguanine DNA glycosylase
VEEALDERIDAALPTRSGVPPLSRRLRGWRAPATGNVWDALVAAVLEQRVTGREARSAWARLLADHGSPVPGPAPGGMIAPPTFDAIRMVPSWWWRRAGVDRQRSDTLVRLSRLRHVVERLPDVNHAESRRLLTAVPGVGVWTHAEVAQRALGDDDSVSVGDFHLAGQIVYAFTGGWAGTDEQMLELLEPFAGHRYRVVRAVELAGISRPRRGPRMPVPPRVRG